MFLKASNLIFEKARALRNNPTHAETRLWGNLRQSPLQSKFRRQHPIAQYVAFFYCHKLKLIIEVDGKIHSEEDIIINDAERQAFSEAKGVRFFCVS